MRCFVAIDLDPELRSGVEDLQKGLKGFDVKLVEPYNLHFTLKFLGEVDNETLERITSKLAEIASKFEPFEIDIKGVGCFPSENFIRVVWVGSDKLSDLQLAVNDSLNILDKEKPNLHDVERQPISHLTIARVRSQSYVKEIKAFANKNKSYKISQMIVNAIKLKKSTVTPKGPVYEDLVTFNLSKRE